MSSTETPSAPAESLIVSLDSIRRNPTPDVIMSSSLPWQLKVDLYSFVLKLSSWESPASALRELPELLAAITDAVALALSSHESSWKEKAPLPVGIEDTPELRAKMQAILTGPISPSPRASPSPTSAETGAARDGGTGAPSAKPDYIDRFDYGKEGVLHMEPPAFITGADRYVPAEQKP
jgi:hypothetical protein